MVTGFLGMGLLLPNSVLKASPIEERWKTPSYAGFEDIHPAKNDFILVGDTQSTSRWEFEN